MNSIYIGDRQLDPDEEHECPHCFRVFDSTSKLMRHVSTCSENDDIDYPDNEPYHEDQSWHP